MESFRLNYKPRGVLDEPLHRSGWKKIFIIAHRRMGKTYGLVAEMALRVLNDHRGDGQYLFLSPEKGQTIRNIGNYFQAICGEQIRKNDRDGGEIVMKNGAKIFYGGARTAEALRGSYLDGCIVDEASQVPDEVYNDIIFYALKNDQRGDGWIAMAGTARVDDDYKLYKMWKYYKGQEGWICLKFGAHESGVFTEKRIAEYWEETKANYMSRGRSEEDAKIKFNVEFLCDFSCVEEERPVLGAIFGEELNWCYNNKRIVREEDVGSMLTKYDPGMEKYAVFYLGDQNYTAFWVVQDTGYYGVVSDCYWNHNQPLRHYWDLLKAKGIKKVVLPHDASRREKESYLTIAQLFQRAGFEVYQLKRTAKVVQIDLAKKFLTEGYFLRGAMNGMTRLAKYANRYNNVTKQYDLPPSKKDEVSDVADAFMYTAQFIAKRDVKKVIALRQQEVYNSIKKQDVMPTGSDILFGVYKPIGV